MTTTPELSIEQAIEQSKDQLDQVDHAQFLVSVGYAAVRAGDLIEVHEGSQDSENDPYLRSKERILGVYGQFEEAVSSFGNYDSKQLSSHPDFLGAGGSSDVIGLAQNGHDYAVRVVRGDDPETTKSVMDGYVDAMSRGVGVRGLEQMIAASYGDAVTVSEFVPGRSGDKLADEDFGVMTVNQFDSLLGAFEAMQERGLIIDPSNPQNIHYDKDQGFTIIDYAISPEGLKQRTISQDIKHMVHIMTLQTRMADKNHLAPEGYAEIVSSFEKPLAAIRLLASAVENRYGDSDATETAKTELRYYEDLAKNYADPEWVTRAITQEQSKLDARNANVAAAEQSDDLI